VTNTAGIAGNAESAGPAAEAITVVLCEGPDAAPLPPERLAEIVRAAVAAGYRVTRGGPGAAAGAVDTSAAAIVGEFGGGQAPAVAAGRSVRIDATGKCACGVVGAIDQAREALGLPRPGQWVPWFPVIDFDRCVGCNQCANFCLFGVYTTDGGVRVANPASCKTNCPACARMCPQGAIIFPYYPTGPINGRDASAGSPAPMDLRKALQGDVYEVLRNRQGSGAAGGPVVPTPAELAKIARQAEIPPQVLMSLGVASPAPADAAARGCDCACGCDCSDDADGDCGCGGQTCDCDCEDESCGCDCGPQE